MVDPLSIERASAALDTVDDVAFFKQEFGKVRAVLASDAGNEGDFGFR
jgi:hypothetical protein